MKGRLLSGSMLLFVLSYSAAAQGRGWFEKMKSLELLSFSRDDVLKLMGDPVENDRESHIWYYDFKEGRMSILFSSGVCKSKGHKGLQAFSGWNVPAWRIVEIAFSPDERVEPEKLNIISFDGFSTRPIHGGREGIEYTNDELGIDYIVNEGKIQNIIFRPAKSYEHLRCK